jgi:hypothetical protein
MTMLGRSMIVPYLDLIQEVEKTKDLPYNSRGTQKTHCLKIAWLGSEPKALLTYILSIFDMIDPLGLLQYLL